MTMLAVGSAAAFEELCEFTGEPVEEVREKVAGEYWRTAQCYNEFEGTPEEFYESTDAYLYELANWEDDGLRGGLAHAIGQLGQGRQVPVLEYGFGIGSFVFNEVCTGIVNPDNVQAIDGIFPPSVNQNVPRMLLVLVVSNIFVVLISFFMIFDGPDHTSQGEVKQAID